MKSHGSNSFEEIGSHLIDLIKIAEKTFNGLESNMSYEECYNVCYQVRLLLDVIIKNLYLRL